MTLEVSGSSVDDEGSDGIPDAMVIRKDKWNVGLVVLRMSDKIR